MRNLLFSFLLITAFLSGSISGFSQNAPLRVMPLGDSNTRGTLSESPGGYRLPLQHLLDSIGVKYDYVGSQVSHSDGMADPEHEGYGGWRVFDILYGRQRKESGLKSLGVEKAMEIYKPDIILLMAGINDVFSGKTGEEIAKEMSILLAAIFKKDPGVKVLLGNLSPISRSMIVSGKVKKTFPAEVDSYNRNVRDTIANFTKKGYYIGLVDMRGSVRDDQLVDDVHPNAAAITNMAKAWFEGMLRNGFLRNVHGQSKSIFNPVIAHMGAWKSLNLPENSLASLKQAIKLGCAGSEFDVRMTADGVPVVLHDPVYKGISIDSSNFSRVKKLRLSNGENLPTLEAYLMAGAVQSKTRLVLEIKELSQGKQQTLLLTRKCVEMVHWLKMEDRVDYISFDYDACRMVKKLSPTSDVYYLSGDLAPALLARDSINGVDYNLKVYEQNEDWIDDAKRNGILINVWTVNKREEMIWFLNKGVNFITTDEPELLFSVVQ